LSKFRI